MAAAACVEMLSTFSAHFDLFYEEFAGQCLNGDHLEVCRHLKHQIAIMQVTAQKATDSQDFLAWPRAWAICAGAAPVPVAHPHMRSQ